jgi:hypothetical protein
MHRCNRLGILLIMATSTQCVFGATLIELTAGDGDQQKMWLEGHKMRVEVNAQPSYILMDTKNRKLYTVNTKEREAMDMSSIIGKNKGKKTQTTGQKASLVKKGKGPTIAGYSTVHYELLLGSHKCSDEYLSRKALADIATPEVFDALSQMSAATPMATEMMDPCDAASITLSSSYKRLGYPLRTLGADGKLEMEVKRIVKNAPAPPGGFTIPKGYKVTNFEQVMQRDMPQNMPEGMDPADMERMMQEMMKQREAQ